MSLRYGECRASVCIWRWLWFSRRSEGTLTRHSEDVRGLRTRATVRVLIETDICSSSWLVELWSEILSSLTQIQQPTAQHVIVQHHSKMKTNSRIRLKCVSHSSWHTVFMDLVIRMVHFVRESLHFSIRAPHSYSLVCTDHHWISRYLAFNSTSAKNDDRTLRQELQLRHLRKRPAKRPNRRPDN